MYGGPQTNFESDVQPSCRSSLPNISTIPFLDMSSFQPPAVVSTNRQSGFESMESMDSGKTTPMNYMRKTSNNGMSRIDPIRNKSRDSEDGNVGNFLRSAAPAYDALDIETFGEIATYRVESGGDLTPEPWIESSPLTARESLKFPPATTSSSLGANQYGMEPLNLSSIAPGAGMHGGAYQQEPIEPYYAHDSRPYGANLDDGYFQQSQSQSQGQQGRPLSFPPHGQHFAPQQQVQAQYQQQGQGQSQYLPQGYAYSQQGQSLGQGGYTNTTPRSGAVGTTSAPPRRTSHPPSQGQAQGAPQGPHGHYQQQQGQGQSYGYSQAQGQYSQHQQYGGPHSQHAQHTQHGQSMHQYNHGSYASAPQTPLSVYRALQTQNQGQGQGQVQGQMQGQYSQYQHLHSQGQSQGQAQGLRSHSHSSEEDLLSERTIQPFGRVSRDLHDGPLAPSGNSRALYPAQHQQQGGASSAPVRTPKMGTSYSQHHHQTSHPQHQGHSPQTSAYPSTAAASGMLDLQQELVYQVQFKRGCRAFTLSARAGISVAERDFVVVEADRGEDIGIVVEIMTMHAFLERRMNAIRPSAQQQGGESEDQNVGCILRLATLHERQQLPDKFHAEKEIVQSCNDLAQHGFGLPITVFEAEFQFDRRKLTVYYDCTVRIDFRDFVRQLYSTYKARIWMKKMSPSVVPEVQPFAAMALATGVQFSAGGADK